MVLIIVKCGWLQLGHFRIKRKHLTSKTMASSALGPRRFTCWAVVTCLTLIPAVRTQQSTSPLTPTTVDPSTSTSTSSTADCFSSSYVVGSVLGTFFATGIGLGLFFCLLWWICERRRRRTLSDGTCLFIIPNSLSSTCCCWYLWNEDDETSFECITAASKAKQPFLGVCYSTVQNPASISLKCTHSSFGVSMIRHSFR